MDKEIDKVSKQGERVHALLLHARRYDFLRESFLEKLAEAMDASLRKVRALVLTGDLAIKILAHLSPKHTIFRERGVALAFIDEIHNVSRNQLIAIASHVDKLVCAGDKHQKLSKMERMGADCYLAS